MEWHEWVEVGRLYVSTEPNSQTVVESLWFGSKRGDHWIHVIAARNPYRDSNYPILFENYEAFSPADGPLAKDPDRVAHRLATDDDLALFIGQMVTRSLHVAPVLDFERWARLGLLPGEAERIRRAWARR